MLDWDELMGNRSRWRAAAQCCRRCRPSAAYMDFVTWCSSTHGGCQGGYATGVVLCSARELGFRLRSSIPNRVYDLVFACLSWIRL